MDQSTGLASDDAGCGTGDRPSRDSARDAPCPGVSPGSAAVRPGVSTSDAALGRRMGEIPGTNVQALRPRLGESSVAVRLCLWRGHARRRTAKSFPVIIRKSADQWLLVVASATAR